MPSPRQPGRIFLQVPEKTCLPTSGPGRAHHQENSDDGWFPLPISLRQILWVAAGAAILTFLVAVASWLFSPRSSQDAGGTASTTIQETTLDKKTFTPEPTGPGRARDESATRTGNHEAAGRASAEGRPERPRDAIPSSGSVPEAHAEPEPTTPPVPSPKPPPSAPSDHAVSKRPGYGIQVGAFSSAANALQVKQRLDASGYRVSILHKADVHKVVVTGFADRAAANKTLADLRHKGFPKAFIVPVE